MAKKSFYVFLTSLLGVLLFLILHRTIVIAYLYLVAGGYGAASFDYYQFLFWDYFSLVLSLMLGAWYGVWLGLNWYAKVYEEKTHGGFVDHLIKTHWSGGRPKTLDAKISDIKEQIETDLWQLEDLAKAEVSKSLNPEPKVRKVVRKRAPKKLSASK